MKNLIATLLLCAASSTAAWSQARPTADRLGDLQVGVDFSHGKSDYGVGLNGYGVYADFDFMRHIGAEVDFHQLKSNEPASANNGFDAIYERSYEAGARYFRQYGRFKPYIRAMYGRGVFNFPYNEANLAYNQADLGGGVDIAIIPRINARVDYEYQRWFSFPPDGLTPQMVTIGVAYHFPAGKPKYLYAK